MRPQTHSDAYRYRNINLQGEIDVPDFNFKKYGRNSLKSSSALLWNFFNNISSGKMPVLAHFSIPAPIVLQDNRKNNRSIELEQ